MESIRQRLSMRTIVNANAGLAIAVDVRLHTCHAHLSMATAPTA
jgi:hypothetical protein